MIASFPGGDILIVYPLDAKDFVLCCFNEAVIFFMSSFGASSSTTTLMYDPISPTEFTFSIGVSAEGISIALATSVEG